MKKFIGPCLAFLLGGLTFLFLSVTNLVSKVTVSLLGTATVKETAWEIMENYTSNVDGYVLYKIGVIAMIVLASLLIISSVVLLLKNLNVIKFNKVNFNLINNVLLTVFVGTTLLAFIGTIVMSSYLASDAYVIASSASIGVGMWLALILNIVGCVCAWIFARDVKIKKSKARKSKK